MISEEDIEQLNNRTKPFFLTELQIENILYQCLKDNELDAIRLEEFKCYLEGLWIKLMKPPISNKAKEQIDMIERMKSQLGLIQEISLVNKLQSKILSRYRLKMFQLEQENIKLKKVIE